VLPEFAGNLGDAEQKPMFHQVFSAAEPQWPEQRGEQLAALMSAFGADADVLPSRFPSAE